MSQCIKTGAVIQIDEYNYYAACDIHAFDGVIVCNINPNSVVYSQEELWREPTHFVTIGDGYYHEDKGVLVTSEENLSEL